MRRALPILMLMVVAMAVAPQARADIDHAVFARDALDNYLRPGYARFAGETQRLHGAIGYLCDAPSQEKLGTARDVFRMAALAFSHIEPARFGPIAQGDRFERVFFWPDSRGIARRQIAAALQAQSPDLTDPVTLASKSVALQGFPALEELLFGEGSETLAKEAGFRCAYAEAASVALASLASEAEQALAADSDFTTSFLSPGPDRPRYRSGKETTMELMKAMTGGMQLVRDLKIGRPLGDNPKAARPALAPYVTSGLTFPTIAANLEGVRTLFVEGGFAALVDAQSEGISQSVLFDLDRAIGIVEGIEMPPEAAFRDEATRAQLSAVMIGLTAAERLMRDQISAAAGLSFGFNALDGD